MAANGKGQEVTFIRDTDPKKEELPVTFIDKYCAWASTVTDAPTQYHRATGTVILSAIMTPHLKLPTSFGEIIPNIWMMMLAGTAQPLDEPVLTPDGWVEMGSLDVGDYVIGSDSQPTKVIGIYPQGKITNYEVTFNNGATVQCSGNHLWTTRLHSSPHVSTVSLNTIIKHLEKSRRNKPRIPVLNAPIEFNHSVQLGMHPYILGMWLAEGSRSQYYVSIASSEEEIFNHISECLPDDLALSGYNHKSLNKNIIARGNIGKVGSSAKFRNSIREELRELDLLTRYGHERFIPNDYLTSSIENRLELLRGLMDGDGTVSPDGYIRIELRSEQLIDDISELVRSLGGRTSKSSCGTRNSTRKETWKLSFSMLEGLNPFKMRRKAELFKPKKNRWLSIDSVKQIDDAEMVCIEVDNRDNLYVTNNYILTHNTVTRKSTSLDLARRLLDDVTDDYLLATDGSPEGLLTELSYRDGKVSLFHRDEITGFMSKVSDGSYMTGILESFTRLYDGKDETRLLRRERIEIKKPYLIFMAGGIKTKMEEIVGMEHIRSGFLPRFLFVTGSTSAEEIRPIGPPTEEEEKVDGTSPRDAVLNELWNINQHYTSGDSDEGTATLKIGGVTKIKAKKSKSVSMKATPDTWLRIQEMKNDAVVLGENSTAPDLYTPLYDRLSNTVIKVAILLAGADFSEVMTLDHIYKAINLSQEWLDAVTSFATAIENQPDMDKWEKKALKIIQYVTKAHPRKVTQTEVMQRFRIRKQFIEDIEATLVARGDLNVYPYPHSRSLHGGKIFYTVNFLNETDQPRLMGNDKKNSLQREDSFRAASTRYKKETAYRSGKDPYNTYKDDPDPDSES